MLRIRPTAGVALAVALLGCEGAEPCEENVGAQTLDERVTVEVGEDTVFAELADDAIERERGWRKRACNREGLLLVPDSPSPLPVWGCELVAPIDVIGIDEGRVVFIERLSPCQAPCGGCPTVGDEISVSALLEVPANALDVSVGISARIP